MLGFLYSYHATAPHISQLVEVVQMRLSSHSVTSTCMLVRAEICSHLVRTAMHNHFAVIDRLAPV